MPAIRVTVDSEDALQALDRLSQVQDFTPAIKQSQAEIIASVHENFAAQGRPTRWQRLSDITLALRRGTGAKILLDTGKLRQSIVPGADGSITRSTPNELIVGTNLIYASVHQFGATIKVKNAKMLARLISAGGMVKVGPNQYRQQGTAGASFTKGGKVQKKFKQLGDAFNQVQTTKAGVTWAVFGTSVQIPARPFLVLQAEDEQAITEIFQRHVERVIGGGNAGSAEG